MSLYLYSCTCTRRSVGIVGINHHQTIVDAVQIPSTVHLLLVVMCLCVTRWAAWNVGNNLDENLYASVRARLCWVI